MEVRRNVGVAIHIGAKPRVGIREGVSFIRSQLRRAAEIPAKPWSSSSTVGHPYPIRK